MCAFQGVGAVSVFKECARMRPEDPSLPLLAAKVCIDQLHWVITHVTSTCKKGGKSTNFHLNTFKLFLANLAFCSCYLRKHDWSAKSFRQGKFIFIAQFSNKVIQSALQRTSLCGRFFKHLAE